MELKTKKRISDNLEKMINIQLQRELDSSMIYLSMAEWFEYNGWFGASELYRKYSSEEYEHMEKFKKYLQDRNALPTTPASTNQSLDYKGLKDIVQKTYEHELQVSDWINEIAKACLKEGDLTTYQFLNWFIDEQIGEENKALYWIDRIEMIENEGSSLYFIDKEMKESTLA